MSIVRIARPLFTVLAALAMIAGPTAHAEARESDPVVTEVAQSRAGADKLAAPGKYCKGLLHPETGGWFSEQVRAGDLHAALVANKVYTVGNAYAVQLWSGGKWNAGYAIIHNVDNDGVCEVRAAPVP